MNDTNFERQPLPRYPQPGNHTYLPVTLTNTEARSTCFYSHAMHYVKATEPYFALQLELLQDKEIILRLRDNTTEGKQTTNTCIEYDDPHSKLIPGPWTLIVVVTMIVLGSVCWAVGKVARGVFA